LTLLQDFLAYLQRPFLTAEQHGNMIDQTSINNQHKYRSQDK